MTTSAKFQRHSFEVAFILTAKSVRSHILTFGIFENRIAGEGWYEDFIIGAGAGAGVAGAGTFCPEPEPGAGAAEQFYSEPEPEPEPECFPGAGAGAGADQKFHGSASLIFGLPSPNHLVRLRNMKS